MSVYFVHSCEGSRAAITDNPQTDDLFAFCDQDDVWHSDKIEKQVAFLRKEKVDSAIAMPISSMRTESSNCQFDGRRSQMDIKDCFPGLLLLNDVAGMTAFFAPAGCTGREWVSRISS